MERKTISSGSRYEKLYGHCRAVVAGDLIFVSGTVGFDWETGSISDDPAEQTHQTFRNIESALQDAGASFADIVHIVTYYVNQADWDAIGEVLKEWLKDVRPVNAGIRVDLIDPRMKIEISAIAVRGCSNN